MLKLPKYKKRIRWKCIQLHVGHKILKEGSIYYLFYHILYTLYSYIFYNVMKISIQIKSITIYKVQCIAFNIIITSSKGIYNWK